MNNIPVLFDLHMHTHHSDGKNSVAEMADAGKNKNLQVGLSDHGPGHLYFGVRQNDLIQLPQEIEDYQQQNPDIQILQGIEANFMGHGQTDLDKINTSLDYALAGYHKGIFPSSLLSVSIFGKSLMNKDRRVLLMTDEAIAVMEDPRIIAITHPGEYIPIDMNTLSKAAAEKGVLLEINERHPCSSGELIIAQKNGAHFLLSSDAHHTDAVGRYPKSMQVIEQSGIDPKLVVNFKGYQWDQPNLRIYQLHSKLT